MKRRYLAAIVQMDTSAGWAENLRAAEDFVDRAARQGAALIAFSECFSCYEGGRTREESLEDSPTLRRMADKARQHEIWILCGSLYTPGADGRHRNTSVLIDPAGEYAATYDKLHLFDVTLPDGQERRESQTVCPGERIVMVDTELGHLGMSVCYDLRFPELYRTMTLRGAQVLLIPAMFARQTGQAHWEVLLRARAIENGCYVIAPNQVGGRFDAYGHAMIVDPWGRVIAEIPEGQDIAYGEIDLDLLDGIRRDLPSLKNRRGDLY